MYLSHCTQYTPILFINAFVFLDIDTNLSLTISYVKFIPASIRFLCHAESFSNLIPHFFPDLIHFTPSLPLQSFEILRQFRRALPSDTWPPAYFSAGLGYRWRQFAG